MRYKGHSKGTRQNKSKTISKKKKESLYRQRLIERLKRSYAIDKRIFLS